MLRKDKSVKDGRSMTKEELAGEIFDLNKAKGYKNPFSRTKAINIMVNGEGTAKGYTKAELVELRDGLLNKPSTATRTAKQTQLSPKVEKADELRKKSNKAMTDSKKLVKKWTAELAAEKSSKKRDEINQKYTKLFEEADAAEQKAYAEYYGFVNENFDKTTVASAVKSGLKGDKKGFTGKTFITALEKSRKQQSKKK